MRGGLRSGFHTDHLNIFSLPITDAGRRCGKGYLHRHRLSVVLATIDEDFLGFRRKWCSCLVDVPLVPVDVLLNVELDLLIDLTFTILLHCFEGAKFIGGPTADERPHLCELLCLAR